MELKKLKLSEIKPSPYNPREIHEEALSRLEKSIREFGVVDPLIVNKRTGNLVGGHQRLKVLERSGASEVDCVLVDLPESREKALNVALNNAKMQGEYDFGKLADLLQEIDTGEFDVAAMTGFSQEELEQIASWTPHEQKLKDLDLAPPPEMAWVLIGIPTVRFGEIAETVQSLAAVPGIVMESTANNG